MHDPRSEMARICRLAYERRLLDSAGGNLSVRADDCVYLSRRYAGARQQWELTGDDFLVCDLEGNRLGGHGDLSRETAAHLACYRAFPEAGCVFHAHPLNVMVFVSAGVPIPPSSEQTDKFGPIGFCQHAPAHSHELAHYVVEGLRPQADQIPQHAIAILVPRHGIFVVGKDLNAAYDGLERIDRAAYMALMARLLRVG
ncbi:MAG: class II aldolase/adducin family protein [Armatimonadetes bacterium]|nr:class II aldolase/adducin family protein [Armatimonadota bacterium]